MIISIADMCAELSRRTRGKVSADNVRTIISDALDAYESEAYSEDELQTLANVWEEISGVPTREEIRGLNCEARDE